MYKKPKKQTLTNILDQCGNDKWTDPEFPPEGKSLYRDWDSPDDEFAARVETWSNYEWIRATDIPSLNDDEGDLAVFFEEIEPADIKQGSLGDCYFLTVMSVLAEWPDRVRKLFITDEVSPQGVYAMWMIKNGVRQVVCVDDFIVCNQGRPAFCQANGNELWCILLEKAWAKIHGDFERIIGGQNYLTMRDLTGAPSFDYTLSEVEDPGVMIQNADGKNWIMGTGINNVSAEEKKILRDELGLITGHAYALIAAKSVTSSDGQYTFLVKIRNPWGRTEWKGDWSDESELWNDEARQICDLGQAEDDGSFWMNMQDFKKYFSDFQITKYEEDYEYRYIEVEQGQELDSFVCVEIDVPEQGNYCFSVNQKGKRMFQRGCEYQYGNPRMILMKIKEGMSWQEQGAVEYISGKFGRWERDCNIECSYDDNTHLEGGKYMLFVDMEWDDENHQGETGYVISCYGQEPVQFGENLRDQGMEIQDILRQVFLDFYIECKMDSSKKDFNEVKDSIYRVKYDGQSEFGYQCIFYKNETEDMMFIEESQFNNVKGISLLPPFADNDDAFKLELHPQSIEMVIVRCKRNYGYGMSMSYGFQGTDEVGDGINYPPKN